MRNVLEKIVVGNSGAGYDGGRKLYRQADRP
jgi:hypothetical protein